MAERGSSEDLVEMIKQRILQQILDEISGSGSGSQSLTRSGSGSQPLAARMRAGYIKSDNDNYGSYTKD